MEIKNYRVYGMIDDNGVDEYVAAHSAQEAVDMVRNWFDGRVQVLEVARVVKGWK